MQKKILVVGGVAGGASFAARMRRLDENAEIIIFEKGEYVSFANCGLPYHIGNIIKNRNNLILQNPESFKIRFNIDVRINSEVIRIDPENRKVEVKSNNLYEETYDELVLSPGCRPIRPPIKGIENERIFTLRNIPDMDKIKGVIDSSGVNTAIIIGGGFIGLEMAENLKYRGIDVTIIELANQVFMPADQEMANILHNHIINNSIKLNLKDGVKEFTGKNSEPVSVILNSGNKISADIVILAIGVQPDTEFVKGTGIDTNKKGAICVDKNMRTNIEHIYAVGDAVEVQDFVLKIPVMIPLAGPANRQGRIVADNIAGIISEYKHTQGTSICKVLNLTAAVTGINEKRAEEYGISYTKSYTHSSNHAEYYPGASSMSVKILFEKQSGKLLGAQIIGTEGVDKRIDVFATAIRHGLTVDDLSELELAYAPPYGSAKDPVNIAGFVAQNIISNIMPVFYSEDLKNFDKDKQIILDVRTPPEYNRGTIEDSINIPLDELRTGMDKLDKQKEILVFCQIGFRGHLATRILLQNGFKVKNLSGGYTTFLWNNYEIGVS